MFIDFLLGIASSLIASIIVGFLGNLAVTKQNSIVLKIYVLFLATTVFVVSSITCIVLNDSFSERIMKISESNLLRFYNACIVSLIVVLFILAIPTVVIIVAEISDKSAKREHKEMMDRLKL